MKLRALLGALILVGTVGLPGNAAFRGANGHLLIGTQVEEAFASEGALRLFDLPVSKAIRFPLKVNYPEFSPDGRWVAFVDSSDGNAILYKSRPDGNEQQALTDPGSVGRIVDPAWSPDGQRIVFAGRLPTDTSLDFGDLFMVDADGTDLIQITDDTAAEQEPVWSPDGVTVIYVRCDIGGDTSPYGGQCGGPDGELHSIEIGNGVPIVPVFITNGIRPDISPDGRTVVYECNESRRRICMISGSLLTGQHRPVVLWSRRNVGMDPVWSPDGRWIAFTVQPATEEFADTEIYTIRPDGSGVRQITDNRRPDYVYDWKVASRAPSFAVRVNLQQLTGLYLCTGSNNDPTGRSEEVMRIGSSHRKGRVRVVVASVIVAVGVVVIPPSFDFDSDRDGVPDVTEVYERGTDPAEPDARYNGGVADKKVGKGR